MRGLGVVLSMAVALSLAPSSAAVAAGEQRPAWSTQADVTTPRQLPGPRTAIGTDVPSPGDIVRMAWSTTWAFARCIALIGVPLGIALAIAHTPAVWAWVLMTEPLPAQIERRIGPYAGWIKSACGHVLRR